jgi:hypothetical protein
MCEHYGIKLISVWMLSVLTEWLQSNIIPGLDLREGDPAPETDHAIGNLLGVEEWGCRPRQGVEGLGGNVFMYV